MARKRTPAAGTAPDTAATTAATGSLEPPGSSAVPGESQPIHTQKPAPIAHQREAAVQPAGMVRITNGQRDRFIWPVHLSGWEQQGWSPVTAATPVLIAGSTQAADPHANFSLAVNPTGKRQSRAGETGSGAESPDAAEALRDGGMDDLAADPVDLRLEEPLL